ncbi:MAG: segregation and condensation protein A [Anaerolineae bacterium]
MTYRVNLEVFEGPLDLLLSLIRRQELEITAISLATVTDQYLAYMEDLQEIDPGAMAGFLEVAAQLVLIKSRYLLPRPGGTPADGDEEDPAEVLARRLHEYAQFKDAAQALRTREAQGLRAYVRVGSPPALPRRVDFGEVSVEDLLAAVREALETQPPAPPVSEVVEPITVTIGERIGVIRRALHAGRPVTFRSLLRDCRSRIEIIVTFLGLLELMKAGEVLARQDTLFGEIALELGAGKAGPHYQPSTSH